MTEAYAHLVAAVIEAILDHGYLLVILVGIRAARFVVDTVFRFISVRTLRSEAETARAENRTYEMDLLKYTIHTRAKDRDPITLELAKQGQLDPEDERAQAARNERAHIRPEGELNIEGRDIYFYPDDLEGLIDPIRKSGKEILNWTIASKDGSAKYEGTMKLDKLIAEKRIRVGRIE